MSQHALLTEIENISQTIMAEADVIEAKQRIPDSIIDSLSNAGFFRMSVPKEYGGDEVDPLIVFDAMEAMAQADASIAWVTMIISANPLLLGNAISSDVWQELYGSNPNMRSAGTIAPMGRATPVDGGYRVSGHWKYGSGSEHCEYLISGVMVFDGDKPRIIDGAPEIRWIIHPTKDCTIDKNSWDTTGLRGTSSHDYKMNDIFIADEWTFLIGNQVNVLSSPMYKFPTLAFSELAGIGLGMARKAIDIIIEISPNKHRGPLLMSEDPSIQNQIAHAEALVQSSRLYVKETVNDLIHSLQQGNEPGDKERASFRLACTHALDSAVQAVDMMYKTGGGNAIYKNNPLERMFRDIHTAATHIQFNDLTYIKAGRMFLNLDPEDPFF